MDYLNFGDLEGKTLISCAQVSQFENDAVRFDLEDGSSYALYHTQDCCESVYIEDICGDLSDLIGSPILFAREDSNFNETTYGDEQWTFYNIGTNKGVVTIRFHGSSNGYYGTSVGFYKV